MVLKYPTNLSAKCSYSTVLYVILISPEIARRNGGDEVV